MKKLIFPLLSAGAIFAMTSCSADDAPLPNGNDGNVTFAVTLPNMTTRAFGDIETIDCNELLYTIYDAEGQNIIVPTDTVEAFGKGVLTANLSLKLVTNQSYTIVFYAHNNASEFSAYENGNLTVDYSKATVNSEIDDAFYAVQKFTVDGIAKTVTLNRPFAQLNIGTNYLDEPTVKSIISNINSKLTVTKGLYSSIDLISGTMGQEVATDVVLTPSSAPAVNDDFPVEGYSNLLSAYLLVPTTQDLINAQYVINNGETLIRNLNLDATPVRMNYRTNIYGSLLTTDQPFNVQIEPAFEKPDFNQADKPFSFAVEYNPEFFAKGVDAAERAECANKLIADIPNDFDNVSDRLKAFWYLFRNDVKDETDPRFEKYYEGYKGTGAYVGSCGPFYYPAGTVDKYEEDVRKACKRVFNSVTITISGDVEMGGNGSLVLRPNDIYCPVFNVIGEGYAVLNGCKGISGSIGGGYADMYSGTGTLNIKNIHFANIPDKGIGISINSINPSKQPNPTDLYTNIENCVFDGRMYNYVQDGQTINRHLLVKDCVFNLKGTTSYCIFLQQGQGANENQPAGTIEIIGNTFNDAAEGFNIQDRPETVVTIKDNVFNGVTPKADRKHAAAIQMTTGKSYLIENNKFNNVTCNVFRLHDLGVDIKDITIKGNVFNNCAYMFLIDPGVTYKATFNVSEQGVAGVANPRVGQLKDGSTIAHNLPFKY